MALRKKKRFPESPYTILDLVLCWFPADESLHETTMDKLMPLLVSQLRHTVKEWRERGDAGVSDSSKCPLIVSKDANGILTRAILTQNWKDWIDNQVVDFNFERKREIVGVGRDKVR